MLEMRWIRIIDDDKSRDARPLDIKVGLAQTTACVARRYI